MFTGLIETLGTIQDVQTEATGKRIRIAASIAKELAMGESVAVNGVCLTVVEHDDSVFVLQVGPETLARTNLGALKVASRANLERSLRLTDRLGGHLVQGHVDGTGTITNRVAQGDWDLVWFGCAPELAAQMIPKGSIAVDGISLTLVDVNAEGFSVALIPHTLEQTTLGTKKVGDAVNLEIDLIAKYVLKFVRALPLE